MQLAEAYVQEHVRIGTDWTAALPLLERLHDSLHFVLLPNLTLDDLWWSPLGRAPSISVESHPRVA